MNKRKQPMSCWQAWGIEFQHLKNSPGPVAVASTMPLTSCTFPQHREKRHFIAWVFSLKHWRKTGLRNRTLKPRKIPKGENYSTMSSGSNDKRCSHLIAKAEINLCLDNFVDSLFFHRLYNFPKQFSGPAFIFWHIICVATAEILCTFTWV